jgi:hypothetical protein
MTTNDKGIRWRQRFGEYLKMLNTLEKTLSISAPDEIYRAGIIQIFEVTLELG